MAKKKSSSGKKRETNREFERRMQEAQSARRSQLTQAGIALVMLPPFIIDKLGTYIGLSLVGYFALYLPLTALSGEHTILNVLMDLRVNEWVYWLAIFILSGGNIVQGVAHRRYVKRRGQREKALEERLDPNRTSSGLSAYGTPPGGSESHE